MYKVIALVVLLAGMSAARTVNQAGMDLIKKFEPFHADFFVNPNGVKEIGYGHVCVASDCNKLFPPITEAQAEELLKADLLKPEDCVNELVPFVTDNEFSALVSLTSKIGCNSLKGSTLYADVLAKDFTDAAHEFRTFTHDSQGKVDPELVKRRMAEEQLFLMK